MTLRFPALWLVLAFLAIATILKSAGAAESTGDFLKQASIGGQFEISSSRLALQNSQNDNVKNFARQMVDDHAQIDSQLKSVLASSNVDPMQQPSETLDRKHQNMLNRLEKAKGADFDRMYVREQVNAHKQAVSLFRNYAQNGDDPALKNFAAQTLPTLQKHLSEAEQLEKSI